MTENEEVLRSESYAAQLRRKNLFRESYRLGRAIGKLPRWRQNIYMLAFKLLLYISYYLKKYIVIPLRKRLKN